MSRQAVVTGMGFCLPGLNKEICTEKESFWEIISKGTSCIEDEGLYFGHIYKEKEDFTKILTEVPEKYINNYSNVHLYGLTSLKKACEDAGLNIMNGDLQEASVLTARANIDACFDSYQSFVTSNPEYITPKQARDMFARLAISGATTDVVNVQAAFLQTTGTTFTVTCGCASSAVLIGLAKRMIETGESNLIVITGVDSFEFSRINTFNRLKEIAQSYHQKPSFDAPPTDFLLDKQMRPYDKQSAGYNGGVGSVTLIVESEEHAIFRGAHIYGKIGNQGTSRSPLPSALTLDQSGLALINATKKCIDGIISIEEITYINGGAQGDILFNIFENNAVKKLFKERTSDVLVSSQEGCFGHNGAPLGTLGVAATLLMMEKEMVCPTAGCTEKSPDCDFDPIPGKESRTIKIDNALSFNYQAGGVCSTILLQRYTP